MWQARQESLDRLVAVKVDQRTLDDEREQRRFLREAGAAGRLSGHPGIVTVHDAGILPDDRPYLVMELCPGGSLTRWLKPEGRPSEQRILQVGIRIADALAAAHSRGVLHRDVKPANILIDSYDNPGLADFGLAALPEPGVELSVTLEALTPAYAPKEAFYLLPPTEVADVFSLAATLYAILGGKPPRYPETGTPNLPELLKLQADPITPLADVHPAFMNVLMRALSDDPADRPTAAQFRDQLAAVELEARPEPSSTAGLVAPAEASGAPTAVDGEPTASGWAGAPTVPAAAAPVQEADRSAGMSRRGRTAVVALVVTAVVLLALLIGSLTRTAPPSSSPSVVPSTTTLDKPLPTPSSPASVRPSASTPTPTSAPPVGFADCSKQFGGVTYCLTKPECWGGLISLSDLPSLATPQDCDQTHVYQTFAAGKLDYVVRRQSQLEADKQVKSICNLKTLDAVLVNGGARNDWEIIPIPPQLTADITDTFYRCLAGYGERNGPLKLRVPR